MRRKRVDMENMAYSLIIYTVARVMYVTGLTLLIPFVFLMLLPELPEGQIFWFSVTPAIFSFSTALIIISFVILFWRQRRIGRTLKSLGLITLIPGAAGLMLGLLGRKAIFNFLSSAIVGFETVEPVINFYLDNAIPKIMLLTVSFIFLGILMWLMGDKIDKGLL